MRPLVLRCGGFGEVVLLTALLEQLHARLGEPVDVISSGAWTPPLLKGLRSVGDVFVMRSRKTPYWMNIRQQRLVAWLRERGPGPTWYCDFNDAARDLLRRGGIPDNYVCDSRDLSWIAGEHFVERWIRLADMTPPAFEGRLPTSRIRVPSAAKLEVSAQAQLALDRWLADRNLDETPFIVIQPGNKRSMRVGGWLRSRTTNTKYWPEARWAQVTRAVRDLSPEHAILLLGVRAEYSLNAEIVRLARVSGVHNLAGDLPVSRLLPLLQRAAGMISVDTGPAHAAAALGCPTLALFGEADPSLYRPGGVTTRAAAITGQIDGEPAMLGIAPETVIAAWQQLFAGGAIAASRSVTTSCQSRPACPLSATSWPDVPTSQWFK